MSIKLIKDCNQGRKGDLIQATSLSYSNGMVYYKDITGTWQGISVSLVEVM